jgi:hypothetical protein
MSRNILFVVFGVTTAAGEVTLDPSHKNRDETKVEESFWRIVIIL